MSPGADSVALLTRLLAERSRAVILAVLVAQLVIGIGYSLYLGETLVFWDEREYAAIAQSLVDEGRFVFNNDRAFRPPLFPGLVAVGLGLGLPVQALRVGNFLFLLGATWLLARAVSRAHGPAAGAVAALWTLAYPVLLYVAGTLYPQMLGGFLLLATINLMLDAEPRQHRRLALAGLAFGALVLTIPTFLPSLALLLGWLVVRFRRAFVAPCLIVCVCASTLVGSWTLRNWIVLEAFVPVATNSGINLLLGNSENATAGAGVTTDIRSHLERGESLAEVDRDRYYRDAALTWVRANPGRAFRLYLEKLAHFFAPAEDLATKGAGGGWRMLLLGCTYVVLLAALVLRVLAWRAVPLRALDVLFLALYLANAAVLAIFFTRIRFRLPLDLLAIGLASAVIPPLLERLRVSALRRSGRGDGRP
jgi:hypothetical protein